MTAGTDSQSAARPSRSELLHEMGIVEWMLRTNTPVASEPAAEPAAQEVAQPAPSSPNKPAKDKPSTSEPAPQPAPEPAASPAKPAKSAAPQPTPGTAPAHPIRIWAKGQWLVLCAAEQAERADKLIRGLLASLPPHGQAAVMHPLNLRTGTPSAMTEQLTRWLAGLLNTAPAGHILLLGNPLQPDADEDSGSDALAEALCGPNATLEVFSAPNISDLLADPAKRLELWQDLQGLLYP